MYDYKFITIKSASLSGRIKEDYAEIIVQHAAQGWRLHTFTPLPFGAGGQALGIQLIFERLI